MSLKSNNSPAGDCRNMGGALSDGVCSTVQSRGPAKTSYSL